MHPFRQPLSSKYRDNGPQGFRKSVESLTMDATLSAVALIGQQQAMQQLSMELTMMRRDQESDQAVVELIQSMFSSGPVYGASGTTSSDGIGTVLNAIA